MKGGNSMVRAALVFFLGTGVLLSGIGVGYSKPRSMGKGKTVGSAGRKRKSSLSAEQLKLLARYLVEVYGKIQANWDVRGIPLMVLHERRAVVQLWLDSAGKLKGVRILESSGHRRYDKSLLRAVKKSSPFPAPPKKLRRIVSEEGIEILVRRRVFKRELLPLKTRYTGTAKLPLYPPRPRKKNR